MVSFFTIMLDKPYQLRWGMGAMVRFEQLTGIKLQDIANQELQFSASVKVLWSMMQDHIPGITLDDMCKLVDDNVDNVNEFMNTMSKAVQAATQTKKSKNA